MEIKSDSPWCPECVDLHCGSATAPSSDRKHYPQHRTSVLTPLPEWLLLLLPLPLLLLLLLLLLPPIVSLCSGC